jgi:hypothetical protein
MRLAVYAPENGFPLVLTAECMGPSLDCVHQYGPLQLKGVVCMEESLLSPISHSISALTGDMEFVIYAGCARHAVEALMERSGQSSAGGLGVA